MSLPEGIKKVRITYEYEDGSRYAITGPEVDLYEKQINEASIMAVMHGSRFGHIEWTMIREPKEELRPAGPTEIISNLFVGNMIDSKGFDGTTICVLEQRETFAKNATWIPILTYLPTSVDGVTIPRADTKQLDAASQVIDSMLEAGTKVLVHCAAGIERSPLTVVWYLHKKKGMSIDDAYKLIISKRPQVQRRDAWLSTPDT